MIVWRHIDGGPGIPPWLDGCNGVAQQRCLVWLGTPYIAPSLDDRRWYRVADGWEATICGDIHPLEYRRQVDWGVGLMIRDARGRDWWLPSIVAPNGGLSVACVSRLNDSGEWVREPVSELQRAAVDAALEARAAIGDLSELPAGRPAELMCAILESAYHLSAGTISRLGLVDDVLLHHGLRFCAGLKPEVSDA